MRSQPKVDWDPLGSRSKEGLNRGPAGGHQLAGKLAVLLPKTSYCKTLKPQVQRPSPF